jgi:hypothetical protein
VRRLAAVLAVSAAVSAPVASGASAPLLPHGKTIAVYAPLHPTVILFGDSVTLDVTVVLDRRHIDPAGVGLETSLPPFTVAPPARPIRRDLGPITQLRFPLLLRCVTYPCVPTGQTTLLRLRPARVLYALRGDRRGTLAVRLRLPAIEVISQINPTLLNSESAVPTQVRITPYVAHVVPLPRPTYRTDPAVLVGGTIGAAGLLFLAAAALGTLYVRGRLPARRPRQRGASQLEEALALLAWARDHGDDTVRRKAIERVAAELGQNGGREDLAASARRLAWAEPSPPPEEVAEFAERVRREAGP